MKAIPNINHIFRGDFKTTIGTTHERFSAYDNIWIQSNFTKEYTEDHGAYDFDDELYEGFDNAFITARKEISDHIPIWVTFYTDVDDD